MAHQTGITACPLAEAHYHSNRHDEISEKLRGEKDVGPICGFAASLEVGLGATVGTLQTRYSHVQVLSQDKEWGV
jgi:hypothetical protein